jgi:hypothetical protein
MKKINNKRVGTFFKQLLVTKIEDIQAKQALLNCKKIKYLFYISKSPNNRNFIRRITKTKIERKCDEKSKKYDIRSK